MTVLLIKYLDSEVKPGQILTPTARVALDAFDSSAQQVFDAREKNR